MDRSMWERTIVVDTETGGLDPAVDSILSVALVASHGRSIEILIRDESGDCSPKALEINGIDLAAHKVKALWPTAATFQLDGFLEGVQAAAGPDVRLMLAGHNVAFDLSFLRRLYMLAGRHLPRLLGPHRTLDTHTLLWERFARGELPYEATSSEGAFAHLGISVAGRHTALGDAIATRKLLGILVTGSANAEVDPDLVAEVSNKLLEILGLDALASPAIYRASLPVQVQEAMFERRLLGVVDRFFLQFQSAPPPVPQVRIDEARSYLRTV